MQQVAEQSDTPRGEVFVFKLRLREVDLGICAVVRRNTPGSQNARYLTYAFA
jgi:hypothetical protein